MKSRINPVYADLVHFPRQVTDLSVQVTDLSVQAFLDQWPESVDTRAIRLAGRLLTAPGFIKDDEKEVR